MPIIFNTAQAKRRVVPGTSCAKKAFCAVLRYEGDLEGYWASAFNGEMTFKVTGSTIFRLAMVDSFRQKLNPDSARCMGTSQQAQMAFHKKIK